MATVAWYKLEITVAAPTAKSSLADQNKMRITDGEAERELYVSHESLRATTSDFPSSISQ